MRKISVTMNRHQISSLAGMIGPTLFVGVFTIEGWLRPSYHSQEMYVSALSLGLRGWIQITNFVIFGILYLMFTCGVATEFQNGKASKAGPILLSISAICFLLSGPFVMDPMDTIRSQMSVHGILHGIFGGIVFSLMPVICFVFLERFRNDPKWRGLQWWTLGAGMIITISVILLTVATKLPEVRNSFKDWLGFVQRTAIIPYMIWLFIFALGLNRRKE
jgi:Protein of unknown function (DUF998)